MINGEELFPLIQSLDENGKLVGKLGVVTLDDLVSTYEEMRFLRTFDERAWNLQRQGVIGTYAPFKGQEAAQLGAVGPMESTDWLVPTYRDWAACYHRGVSLVHALFFSKGHPGLGDLPREGRTLPAQVVIAAQTLHATGVAWATKLRHEGVGTVALFGDGATSQGDFHEAMNFASVFEVPLVFVCENNQWAISVPFAQQMHAKTIAQRSIGYGIEGYRVDGNDYVAMKNLVNDLLVRARAGEGPFLVEAVTYRLGAHTTADDPGKYRLGSEEEEWIAKDPIARIEKYLISKKKLTKDRIGQITEEAQSKVEDVLVDFQERLNIEPRILFENVYATMTPQLVAQQASFDTKVKEMGA